MPLHAFIIVSDTLDRTLQKLANRELLVRSSDLPVFMYEEGTKYDRDNLDTGFLRSELLVQVSTITTVAFSSNGTTR